MNDRHLAVEKITASCRPNGPDAAEVGCHHTTWLLTVARVRRTATTQESDFTGKN